MNYKKFIGLYFMYRFCLAAFAVAALACASSADEFAISPESVTSDWRGGYVGLHFGGSAASIYLPPPSNLAEYSLNGAVIGGQGGVNTQFDNTVVGVEGDVSVSAVNGRGALMIGPLLAGTDSKVDAVATLRGRLGYAMGDVLLYATGGVAVASVSGTAFEEFGGAYTVLGKSNAAHFGYAVGAGVEGFIADDVSLKGEYLYHKFGSATFNYGAGPVQQSLALHTLKAGLNFHF